MKNDMDLDELADIEYELYRQRIIDGEEVEQSVIISDDDILEQKRAIEERAKKVKKMLANGCVTGVK